MIPTTGIAMANHELAKEKKKIYYFFLIPILEKKTFILLNFCPLHQASSPLDQYYGRARVYRNGA